MKKNETVSNETNKSKKSSKKVTNLTIVPVTSEEVVNEETQSVPEFIISKANSDIDKIFFADVEKVRSKDIMPDYNFCSYNDHKILVEIDGKKTEVNSVSKDYLLVPNKDIFPRLEREMEKFGKMDIQREVKNFSSFFTTYRFDTPENRSEIMKNDILVPRLTIQNSYNSRNLFDLSFGTFRLICSNGMAVQEGAFDFDFSLSHCESNLSRIVEGTLDATSQFLNEFNNVMELTYNPLIQQKVKRSDIEDAVNQILTETRSLLSYKKDIVERIFNENQTKGVELNLFSIYNGINYFLQPGNNEKMTASIDIREKTDKKVLNYISSMVKSA